MDMTVTEILTVLFDDLIRGLAMYGYAMTGMPLPEDLNDQ
jgi:hypothetical protein